MKVTTIILFGAVVSSAVFMSTSVRAEDELVASICDYVAADDKNRLRKKLDDSRLKLRNIYDDILFVHGDVVPSNEQLENVTTVIIGHEHPAISLTNGVRSEQYKCFLKLPWNKRTLIVQPSTFSLTIGSDIRKELILNH